VHGNLPGTADSFTVPLATPHETVSVRVHLNVPSEPGTYLSVWQLAYNNQFFGHRFWCEVVVPQSDAVVITDVTTTQEARSEAGRKPPIVLFWACQAELRLCPALRKAHPELEFACSTDKVRRLTCSQDDQAYIASQLNNRPADEYLIVSYPESRYIDFSNVDFSRPVSGGSAELLKRYIKDTLKKECYIMYRSADFVLLRETIRRFLTDGTQQKQKMLIFIGHNDGSLTLSGSVFDRSKRLIIYHEDDIQILSQLLPEPNSQKYPKDAFHKVEDICIIPRGRLDIQPPSGLHLYKQLWNSSDVRSNVLQNRKLRLRLWQYIHECNKVTIRFVKDHLMNHYTFTESGIIDMKTALSTPGHLDTVAIDLTKQFSEDFGAKQVLAKALLMIRLDDMFVGNKGISLMNEITSSRDAADYDEETPKLSASQYVKEEYIISNGDRAELLRQIVPPIRCGEYMKLQQEMYVNPDPLLVMMRHSDRLDNEIRGTVFNEKRQDTKRSIVPLSSLHPAWPDMVDRPYDSPLSNGGMEKARESLEKLRTVCVIDKIIASPFRRCIQTAGIAARVFGLRDIWIDNRFGEIKRELDKWSVFKRAVTYITRKEAEQTAISAAGGTLVKIHWERDKSVTTESTTDISQGETFDAAVVEYRTNEQYKNLLFITHGDWLFRITNDKYIFSEADWVVFDKTSNIVEEYIH